MNTNIFANPYVSACEAIPYVTAGLPLGQVRVELAKRRARLDGLVVTISERGDAWGDYSAADVDSWMLS